MSISRVSLLCLSVAIFTIIILLVAFREHADLASLKTSESSNSYFGKGLKGASGKDECALSFGKYTGHLWSKEEETMGRTCLLESNRMRVDHHTRKLPDGSSISDWLWIGTSAPIYVSLILLDRIYPHHAPTHCIVPHASFDD